MKGKQLVLSIVLVSLLGVLSVTVLTVPTYANPTVWHVYSGQSIQTAIDGASPEDTIIVHNGTYLEALYINKSLTIKGAFNLTRPVIKGSQLFTTNYRGSLWARNAVIFVVNSTNVVIDSLDVEGLAGPQNGIVYVYSSGKVTNCTVSSYTIGDMSSFGVEARASDLKIDDCTIRKFGRIGAYFANCTGGVYRCTIIGQVYHGQDQVNYGIEVENHQGVRGNLKIIKNKIYNCSNTYSPEPSWSSAGILIDAWSEWPDYGPLPSSNVSIICNNIYDNYNGIEICANNVSSAHYNNIYNNSKCGVFNSPNYLGNNETFEARNNWWGKTIGPYHPTLNPSGTGNPVSDNVNFTPWRSSRITQLNQDVNADGKVDILDIVLTATAYNSHPGDPNWNPYADLNGDNVINILDLVSVAGVYGFNDP
jgi:hypothetical protein